MIYQTDEQFPDVIKTNGCYFLALLWQLNRYFPSLGLWNYGKIMEIYENEELEHTLRSDMEMLDPQAFCDHVTVIPRKVLWVGKTMPDFPTGPNQFQLLCWQRPGVDFVHFTAGDPRAGGYDPYSAGGSLSVKLGKVVGKRIYAIAA